MSEDRLTVRGPDGDFQAYVARPRGDGPWPAVVVIQEIFGINHVMREAADALAAEGFLAVAPDLFWRLEPGLDLDDRKPDDLQRAFSLYGQFDVEAGMRDITAAVAQVRDLGDCDRHVGAVGYCLGGLLAFLTATRTDADAVVSYYGVGIEQRLGEIDGLSRPLMLHIAGEDRFVPKEAQEQIVAALGEQPGVIIHRYPGRDHAFARQGGENFHEADAEEANRRSRQFFKDHLV